MQRRMVTNGGVSSNVRGPSSSNMSSWLNKRRAKAAVVLTTPPQPFLDVFACAVATPFTRHCANTFCSHGEISEEAFLQEVCIQI